MAYDTANPPKKVAGSIGGGENLWTYKSADTIITVRGADYFSDGGDLGMKVGDIVLVSDTTTPAATPAVVSAVTAGAATVL